MAGYLMAKLAKAVFKNKKKIWEQLNENRT